MREWLVKIGNVFRAYGLLSVEKLELERETACRDEVVRKREKALAKAEKIRKKYGNAKVITKWDEDDKYLNDKYYAEKIKECRDKNSQFRRARGWE